MLELKNIVKDYVSGNNTTHALKGISINFRKNEFVSILGASGCGKTTTLNIIGGLDRYTKGDLRINGKSTKKYTDRDWDTYRNHSIGFVFQTYNLIAHQSILKNVELALTISGVSKEERKKRAYEALKTVGLKGMEKKKPNQLSGGQCQRVAIARALINNPEIVLADEPTGALDSETSVQIMELLKKVASDRLVIMVTHNPDLAYKYSTRIIKMSDGLLVNDSNPYYYTSVAKTEKNETKKNKFSFSVVKEFLIKNYHYVSSGIITFLSLLLIIFSLTGVVSKSFGVFQIIHVVLSLAYLVSVFVLELKFKKSKKSIKLSEIKKVSSENNLKGRKKKTSMSLWTSIGLSTSNLISKLRRTILVTIAGSIGIIGVSSVLAVSKGVKEYIAELQNDMLSSYPLSIAEESVDYTSLMSGLNTTEVKEKFEFDPNDPKVGVDSMISYLMTAYSDITNVKTNTIDDKLLNYVDNTPKEDVSAIYKNYGIDPTNNIFGKWKLDDENEEYVSFNGLTRRYISELTTVEGFSSYASYVELFTSFMNELPDNDEYISSQYDVIAGDAYKSGENDLVLVVDRNTTLTDLVLAQTGIFDHDSFLNIAKCAIEEQDLRKDPEFEKKSTEDKEKALKEVQEKYPYPRDFTYEDIIGRDFYYFPQDSIYKEDNHVADDKTTISLNFSILDDSNALDTFVTLSYQSYAGYNLLFGTTISKNNVGAYETKTIACINMETLSSSVEVKSKNDLTGTWLAFEPAALLSLNPNDTASAMESVLFSFQILPGASTVAFIPNLTNPSNFKIVLPNWEETVDPVKGYSYDAFATKEMIENYNSSELKGTKMKISAILRLKDSRNFGSLERGLYYSKAFADKYINDSKDGIVTKALKKHMNNPTLNSSEFVEAFVKYTFPNHMNDGELTKGYASTLNGDLSSSFSDLFSGLTGVNYMETNQVHLRSLCGEKAVIVNDENGQFDHVDFKFYPKEIKIYPKSFEAKDRITDYLDVWNSSEVLSINGTSYSKANRDDLSYTDTISLIVAVIDTFINAITIALVVFTSLSLVVSCFMIAVITYISIVERIKEIGVIRSLGGRKRDVANLFVTETFMTGLFSGVFGVTVTYVLTLILNAILMANFNIAIAHLTLGTALIMIFVSILLSVLSGLIPSQSAAHKDPVVALRSND